MKKEELQKQVKTMVCHGYSQGGIASWNEYNQFLCDIIGQLVPHLSVKGLKFLKSEAQRVYDNMPEYDKM